MDWKQDRIGSALKGRNPMVIAELNHSFVALGDTQFLPGYCVLLPKHHIRSLNELTLPERAHFLTEMSIVGDAILSVCHPLRINYDILGNTDNFLHAHIFPRYVNEPAPRRIMPVWLYSKDHWTNSQYAYSDAKHAHLKKELSLKIQELISLGRATPPIN